MTYYIYMTKCIAIFLFKVERHITSGCKLLLAEKRKRNQCSQSNCKQRSLVPFTCNACYKDFCIRYVLLINTSIYKLVTT